MIQNHLTSQPLSKRLKELKVPQKSYFYWVRTHKNGWGVDKWYAIPPDELKSTIDFVQGKHTSAFLSSELGEILPEFIYWNVSDGRTTRLCLPLIVKRVNRLWWVSYQDLSAEPEYRIYGHETYSESMAESMGLMLEYLILNGLIKL